MTTDRRVDAVRALARVARVLERASDDLSFADYRALAILTGGEERASRLAERLAVGKPAISATVDSLVRRDLILRSPVEGDARASRLSVTPEGEQVFGRMEARMTRQLELLAERTPDPAGLIEALAGLGDAIDEAMSERRARDAAAAASTPPEATPPPETSTTAAGARA